MGGGSADEEPVSFALRSKEYVKDVFDVGMLVFSEQRYSA